MIPSSWSGRYTRVFAACCSPLHQVIFCVLQSLFEFFKYVRRRGPVTPDFHAA
jgi:hypothetical protein